MVPGESYRFVRRDTEVPRHHPIEAGPAETLTLRNSPRLLQVPRQDAVELEGPKPSVGQLVKASLVQEHLTRATKKREISETLAATATQLSVNPRYTGERAKVRCDEVEATIGSNSSSRCGGD